MSDVLPELTRELKELLVKQDELELAAQVSVLRIVDRRRCGDDFCSTFYVQSKPRGGYGPDHRNVELDPKDGMLILDVVGDKIACVRFCSGTISGRSLMQQFDSRNFSV